MKPKINNRKKQDRLKSVFRVSKKSIKISIVKNLLISIICIVLATLLIIYVNSFPKSYLEFSNIEGAFNNIIMALTFLQKGVVSLGVIVFILVLQFISLSLIVISLFRLLRVISYLQNNNGNNRRMYSGHK